MCKEVCHVKKKGIQHKVQETGIEARADFIGTLEVINLYALASSKLDNPV